MKKLVLFLLSLFALLTFSCEVGLGEAVDISIPTVGISYPPKNAIVRSTFVAAGECDDDMGLDKVQVSLFNPETNKTYGPFDATLSEDAKSWSISLNQSDLSKTTGVFDSYKQWDFPDGNYIISAISYDKAKKVSQTATSPISIDNTAPVLIVSKPLATGTETATIYGRSLKLTGDIAEEHETSKLILNYKEYDNSTNDFIDSQIKSIEFTDSEELNAMSSSNPLVIAKFDESNTESEQHKRYQKLYGNNADNVDRYYYGGILVEDNARIYNNPGDNGSGTGNQTKQYYLLSEAFSKNLAVNYSLTAPRLMEILRGDSDSYTQEQINAIAQVLSTQGNFASSVALSETQDEDQAKAQSSKFSLNPHNNPTWSLDEYGISAPQQGQVSPVKSYTAGSSLILSLRAGRDASYPDPKTVKAVLYDLGDYSSSKDYYNESIAEKTPMVLIDPQGDSKWDESADDSEKTYTFTLDPTNNGLSASHVYRFDVTGTDRNKTDLEPVGDNVYVFNLSSSNNIPKVTIDSTGNPFTGVEASSIVNNDKVFGNVSTVTIIGYVDADGVSLHESNPIEVTDFTVKKMDGTASGNTKSDYHFDYSDPVEDTNKAFRYWFKITVTAANPDSKAFIPSTASKYLYTATIKATDNVPSSGTKNVKFYTDNLKPEITINPLSPVVKEGSTEYVNGTIRISGTASDSGNTGSGLKSVSYKIQKADNSWNPTGNAIASDTKNSSDEDWSFDIVTKDSSKYPDGKYVITITATDTVDNTESKSKNINLKQSTDKPELTLSNAKLDITTKEGLVNTNNDNMFNTSGNNKLYGTLKDDDGIAKYIINGAATTVSGEPTEENFVYTLPSTPGEYQIQIQLKDKYADAAPETNFNNSTYSFWITVDNGAPVFSNVKATTNPTSSGYYKGNTTGNTEKLTITGTITEEIGLASSDKLTALHYKKGSDGKWLTLTDSSTTEPSSSLNISSLGATGGTFTDTITLPKASGSYKVVYTAKDKYGQEASVEVEYQVDVVAPEINSATIKVDSNTVSSNAVSTWIKDNNVTVAVDVKDADSKVSKVEYSLDSGTNWNSMVDSGTTVTAGYQNWSSNVTFADGASKTLRFRVTDGVGFETLYPATGDISLKVDKTAPTMELKWYQVKDSTSESELYEVSGKAYVHSKDLVIYGNYSDGSDCSGVDQLKVYLKNLTTALSGSTKLDITYYNKAFTTSDKVLDIAKDANKVTWSQTTAAQIKSFKAVIKSAAFDDGDLYIGGSDIATNPIKGEKIKALTLQTDDANPSIGGIELTKAYQKGSVYYVRNITDGKLNVSGTTTDNAAIDKTVLTVEGLAASAIEQSKTGMNWEYKLNLSSLNSSATIKITAYDKAGNKYSNPDISLVFDEAKPELLSNSSNPYTASYTKRGDPVYKYGNLKIGAGDYSDSSYGRESQIPITVTFVGDEDTNTNASGIATIEYKMIKASKVPANLQNTTTGKFTGTIPATDVSSGIFEVSAGAYTLYGQTTQIPCTIGTATIDGFEETTGGTPNLVFVRATDNCGNESDWFAILVQLDNTKPVITADNDSSILTNGKDSLTTLTGTLQDTGAGLKAARIYVDGKLAIDGCLKGLVVQNDDPSKINAVYDENDKILYVPDKTNPTVKITAKNASGTVISPLTNNSEQGEAVEVTFQNDYGTFKYTAPDAFANCAISASWELTLTPQNGTWFDDIKTKQNPQITIEAEDWAEDSSGSGNKNTDLITTLDIDVKAPIISITSPDVSSALNGTHTIKASVEEEHSPKTVAIYYSKAATAPAALTSWTKLDEKTSSYQIEKDIDLNSTTYIAAASATGKVHILVYAKDEAGNENVPSTSVTANQSDGTKAYKTINIDKNSDRPVVTITNIDLVGNDGTGTNNALSSSNYRKHETNTLNFKVEDDDGIATFEYRITKDGETAPAADEGWKSLTLAQNSGSIKFVTEDNKPSDGKQKIEFRVTDTKGGVFLSETTDALKKIYLKDMAQTVHTYGRASGETGYSDAYATPSIFLNVDTQSPKVSIKGITPLKVSNGTTGTEITNGYSTISLGGPDAKYIKLRVEATDEGTGIKEVEVTATLDGTALTLTSSKLTQANDDGFYYFEIPCFDNGEKKDNKPLSISVTAKDNVNKEASDTLLLKVDDKAPEISITEPSSTENLSGSVTAQGSITNKESATLYYAVSPISTSPDDYAETQAFTFSKTSKAGVTTNNIALPTTNKDGETITTSYSTKLKELCGWNSLDPDNAMLMSFYLWLDGKTNDPTAVGYHADTLNQWILNMGITTSDDLGRVENAFDDIVQLYFHVKAIDAAGNVTTAYQPIKVDPLGKRPKVNIGYPSVPETGAPELVLGGTPSIIGTVEGANAVQYVWLKLDCNGDSQWTYADFNKLVALNTYTMGNMQTGAVVTSPVAANASVDALAIRVSLSGLSWSQKINLGGELNPASGNTQNVKIWAYATDNQHYISNPEERTFVYDKDSPVIDQNLILVQWADGKNGSNGIDYTKTDITFTSGAVKASRAYQEDVNINGKWFLVGKVSDGSGIKNISYRVKNGAATYDSVPAVTTSGTDYSYTTANQYNTGTYIKHITGNNYIFCIPVGDSTDNAVGEYSVEFTAYENESSAPRSVSRTFKVHYDNKAPVIEKVLNVRDYETATSENPIIISNSNGTYKITSSASEKDVNGVEQTGVERVAFYFTRDTSIFDPMIRSKKNAVAVTGNIVAQSGLTNENGLYWRSIGVKTINGAAITLADSTTAAQLANIHKGGLAKISGVIYRIIDVNGKVVTLSEAPGTDTTIKFAIANVIDNPTRESPGKTSVIDDYGYGYTSGGDYEDGDYMIEGLVPDSNDNKVYIWEASINSKNISDGPVKLNYVVFDKAGNASLVQTVQYCFVKNNAPRLAGVVLGTDENGNGSINTEEWISSFSNSYPLGYNESSKVSSLTIPAGATDASPVSVLKIKGFTQIKPEIVGGNGTVGYTYSVAKYNTTNHKWDSPYKTPAANATPVTLGTGTEAEDNNITLTTDAIKFSVEDLLNGGITDGNFQKFSFTIWDSTPGLTYGSTSQYATLNIIMDVALDDTTSAQNKIIPFYWKSKSENSLKDNDSKLGHIELSKDLPGDTFKSTNTSTTIYTLRPKVSGAFKLEGIAQDNSLLKSLSVKIDNTTYEIATYTYSSAEWSEKSGTGWSASIKNATYDELKAAGYITQARYTELITSGIEGTDEVPYASQEFGHVVHWVMNIDTQTMGLTPKAGISISVSAADKGSPYKAGTQAGTRVPNIVNGSAVYTSTTFTAAVTGQTGGNDGTSTHTSEYNVDLVPYVRGIKTALSKKSKKDDTSEYDRTALGHYPVSTTENEIYFYGFNLAKGATVKDSANNTRYLGTANETAFTGLTVYPLVTTANGNTAATVSDFTSGQITVTVNNIEALNNKNNNDAKGSYTGAAPALAYYGKTATYDTFNTYYYNRKPNTTNNYTLTDDIVFDVWKFNSNAAQPNGGGRIEEVFMKINPSSKIIGFSFLDSFKYFALPKGSDNSYNGQNDPPGNADFRSTSSLTYDWRGWSYATDAGGGEDAGAAVHLWMVDTSGNDKGFAFEFANQKGTRAGNNTGTKYNLRYKVRSPSIATSKGDDNNSTNIYMVYYDSFNDEIRFKAGNTTTKGLFVTATDGQTYTCQNAQVIATDASRNLPTSDNRYGYIGTPLGGAGEFVAIDVIPKGTTVATDANGGTTQLTKDVVVIVWYDSAAKAIKYSYNDNPLNYNSWKNANTNHTAYRGLNRQDWSDAKTIFDGASEYCQIKVDQTGGIHIAAYDKVYGDLRYAYLPYYSASYSESTMSYTVDSYGNTGSHLIMDVAYDKAPASGGKAVPYISYWGGGMPKMAYMKSSTYSEGASNDMFNGNWEVTYIPTSSTIGDPDQKRINNLDTRINIALWKYDTNGAVTTIQNSTTGTPSVSATTGKCYGNGKAYPVVGYSISPTSTDDRIETAQMQ